MDEYFVALTDRFGIALWFILLTIGCSGASDPEEGATVDTPKRNVAAPVLIAPPPVAIEPLPAVVEACILPPSEEFVFAGTTKALQHKLNSLVAGETLYVGAASYGLIRVPSGTNLIGMGAGGECAP